MTALQLLDQPAPPAGADSSAAAADHPFTEAAVAAERALARRLDGPPLLNIGAEMRKALGSGGRGQGAMIADMWRLSRGPGRLTPAEYLYYRLWDRAYDRAAQAAFVGKRAQGPMHARCNDPGWFAIAHDKLVFQAVLQGLGLPVPSLLAVYNPARTVGLALQARDEEGLATLLERDLIGPLFAKPIDGMYSLGTVAIDRLEGTPGLFRANGHTVATGDLVRYFALRRDQGYLFQERLRVHPRLAGLIGDRLSTVRVLILVDGQGGAEAVSAVAKLPAGTQVADNYWRADNLLAAVELETGTLIRAINGWGAGLRVVETHPDTGARLAGASLPAYDHAIALARQAAAAFPAIRTQSWDVALTDKGPVLMELNFGGDLNLHQLAHGRGVLTARYREHLADCGYRIK